VLTSSTRGEFVVAISEASLVELPLAVLCLLLARAAERSLHAPTRGHSASVQPRLQLVPEQPAGEPARADRLSA
jgi:hypothetical protein